jgi:hypothetical protein
MSDYFCSAECSAAYSFKLGDRDVQKRKCLINKIESIRRGTQVSIKEASSPRLMKKFGGKYTVEEYRKMNHIGQRSYYPLPPTLIPVITLLEADQMSVTRNDDTLVLKRETPLNPVASLERSMNLRVKNAKKSKINSKSSDEEEV